MPLHVILLYALLISNVVLRLFTNKLGILPKALNIADVFITIWLVLLSLRYSLPTSGQGRTFSFGGRLVAFNFVILAGAVLNLKFFHAPAALSQFIMWNEPLMLFLAITRLPFTTAQMDGLRRLLVRLIVIEIVAGVLQVPIYLSTGQTEDIIGTFYGNAEQYQGFIMLGVFYLLGRQRDEPESSRKLWAMICGVLVLILLIDNKASWLGVMVSILFVLYLQGRAGALWFLRPRYILPLLLLFAGGVYVVTKISPSLGKFSGLVEAWNSGNFRNLGKVKAYDDILHAFDKQWHMALVGSGPGNFYSRSGTQFYLLGMSLNQTDYRTVKVFSSRTSNSMGGVISLSTKPPFYEHFYEDREIYRIGSAQVDSPFSSYAALVGETGIIGTLLYLSIYVGLLRRLVAAVKEPYSLRPQFYPLAMAGIGLLIYMMVDSGYNNWLETGRMTTIAWALAGLLLKPMTASAPVPAAAELERTSRADGSGRYARL